MVASFGQSLSPGNEQRDYWSSQSADTPGGKNLIGIRDAAVDTLIEKLIFAGSREELVAATRASTGCFCPIIMSCRNGTPRMSDLPIGRS